MAEQNMRSRPSPSILGGSDNIRVAVGRVLAQESLRNERKLAYVRTVVLVISSFLDVLVYFFPQTLIGQASVSSTIAVISVTACLIAGVFLGLLRHPDAWRWSNNLQTAIPVFDGVLLFLFITNIWQVLGETQPKIITNIAAFCCLLAASGGIRIRRRASILTTGLALADFAYAAILFRLSVAVGLFALFTVLGTGLLGMLTAGIVRRQGKNEAGRLLMEQFLPETVVNTAFESPLRLLEEPTRCDVTIMVTDLRGFTRYSEKLDPLEVLSFLSQVQGFLSSTVEHHGGWVDKFMGDGMLAVFGAPRTLDNHAEQAIATGKDILREIEHFSPLPIGIGLHSGTIVAGCLGVSGHLEFTVIGDTVNVASRLEAMTKKVDHALVFSEATRRQLDTPQGLQLGRMSIPGREEPIEVFGLPQPKDGT
ncbi:MAG: adenylate/guanylate cyclase domain-containing protein [Leptolyngbyaceae cyanobacterium]